MIFLVISLISAAPVPPEDWSPKTFKYAKPKDAGPSAVAVAVSADGKFVAAGFNGGGTGAGGTRGLIRVWEIESGGQVMATGTHGDLVKVAFSPSGDSVVWGRMYSLGEEGDDNSVFIRGFRGKPMTHTYGTNFWASFALRPDGKRIVVSHLGKMAMCDYATDHRATNFRGFPRGYQFSFTSDGKQLIGARLEKQNEHYLVRLEVESGQVLAESDKLSEPTYTVAISPDGKQAATGHGKGTVRVWDEKWKEVRRFDTKTKGLAHPYFSPDSRFLAAGDQMSGEIVVWDRQHGNEVRRMHFEEGGFRTTYPRSEEVRFRPETDPARFAFTPSGKTILVGYNGVQLIALADGKVIRTFNVD